MNKLSWRMPGTAVQTKSVIIFVLQVASKVPSITLSPNLALTPDAKRFWTFLHRSHPKNIFFQDRHLLYLVRSLLFGSLFNCILLHVGQSGVSTIHYHLVICATWLFISIAVSNIPLFQFPCGFLPWYYLLDLSNPSCVLDWSSWNQSWGTCW